MRYVAFLRAVNVGGRIVKMERVRALFDEMGFKNVRTHIQSGNVFFDSPQKKQSSLAAKIEAHLCEALEFSVPTFVRTLDEVQRAIDLDAFKKVKVTDDVRLSVIFVSQALPSTITWPLRSPKGDFEFLGATAGEVFAVHRIIDGRPSNPVAFLEKTFTLYATGRFFTTLTKILGAARDVTPTAASLRSKTGRSKA